MTRGLFPPPAGNATATPLSYSARVGRFILRVWLPDRPGALGVVATRVGAVGGEIVGIEILERGAGRAIDELVVDLADQSQLTALVREVRAAEGVDVEDLRPAREPLRDPGSAALESAAELFAARSCSQLLDHLAEEVALQFDADWSAVVDVEAPAVRSHTGTPPPAPWLQAFIEGSRSSPTVAAHESGPNELAWAPLAAAQLTVVLGRPVRPFRARERKQLVALAGIAGTRWCELSARSAPAGTADQPGGRSPQGTGMSPLGSYDGMNGW